MQNVKQIAIGVLIAGVSFLTLISILSIWDFLSKDTFWKSMSTIGVISFAALIVVVAANALEDKNPPTPPTTNNFQ